MACLDNKDLCFPSPCFVRTSCSETEIKHVSLAPKFACFRHVIKELVHAFSSAYIELWIFILWMHLGSLESIQEARVALGCVSSNSYASFVFSKLPKCIHNSIYAR